MKTHRRPGFTPNLTWPRHRIAGPTGLARAWRGRPPRGVRRGRQELRRRPEVRQPAARRQLREAAPEVSWTNRLTAGRWTPMPMLTRIT